MSPIDWLLPPFSQPQLVAHLNDAQLKEPKGINLRHKFRSDNREPAIKPEPRVRIWVRVRDASGHVRIVGYHQSLGTTRAFAGTQRDGWQVLMSPHFTALPDPVPDESPTGFTPYTRPGESATLPLQ